MLTLANAVNDQSFLFKLQYLVRQPVFDASDPESAAVVTHLSMHRFSRMYFMSYLHDMGRSCTQSVNVPSCQRLNQEVLAAVTQKGYDGSIDRPTAASLYKANADSSRRFHVDYSEDFVVLVNGRRLRGEVSSTHLLQTVCRQMQAAGSSPPVCNQDSQNDLVKLIDISFRSRGTYEYVSVALIVTVGLCGLIGLYILGVSLAHALYPQAGTLPSFIPMTVVRRPA